MIRSLSCETLKAVEIQLSLKGRVLVLLKEPMQDVVHKATGIMYHKGSSVWLPRHDIGQTLLFHRFQHGMQLERKGNLDPTLDVDHVGDLLHRRCTTTCGVIVGMIVVVVSGELALMALDGIARRVFGVLFR